MIFMKLKIIKKYFSKNYFPKKFNGNLTQIKPTKTNLSSVELKVVLIVSYQLIGNIFHILLHIFWRAAIWLIILWVIEMSYLRPVINSFSFTCKFVTYMLSCKMYGFPINTWWVNLHFLSQLSSSQTLKFKMLCFINLILLSEIIFIYIKRPFLVTGWQMSLCKEIFKHNFLFV